MKQLCNRCAMDIIGDPAIRFERLIISGQITHDEVLDEKYSRLIKLGGVARTFRKVHSD